MSPILKDRLRDRINNINGQFYIFKYILTTSWTGKLENVNGYVIRELNRLLTVNEARRALGLYPFVKDEYLTVRR